MSTQELLIQRARLDTNRRWWIIAALLGLIITLNQNKNIQEFWPLLAVIGFSTLYNFILSILVYHKQIFKFWSYTEILLDLGLIAGTVHFTGGIATSPLFFLFPLLLFIQSFNRRSRELIVFGVGIGVVCGGLLMLESANYSRFLPALDRFFLIAIMTLSTTLLLRTLERERKKMHESMAEGEACLSETMHANKKLQDKISTSTQQLEEANIMLVKKNLAMMALHEIYVAMSSTFNSGRLLNLVIDTAMSLLKANAGYLMLLDSDTKILQAKVARGVELKKYRTLEIKLGQGMEGAVAQTGKEQCTTFAKPPEGLVVLPDTKSKMCVPLTIKQKIVGTITVESAKENAFSRGDLDLFATLGSQASEVLQSIEIYEEMRKKANSLSLLFEVGKSIGNIFNLHRLFDTILERALLVMKAKRGFLMIYDKNHDALSIRASLGITQDVSQTVVRVDCGIAGWVFRNQRPLLLASAENCPEFNPENDRIYGGKDLLACPLQIRKKVFGVICLNDRIGGKHFTRDDLKLLNALAAQAAIAIENVELYASIRRDYLNAIKALAAAVDAKDHYTHGHSNKVMVYSTLVAKELHLNEKEIEKIKYSALLHDVGKIGISEAVLNKPSKLTPKEFDTIAMHPILGVSIVQNIESLKELIPIILYHHERYAGGGYPEGKVGNSIPLGARIVAVADAWDVMTSDRAYREALPVSVAIAELKKCSGTQFDPEIVEAFFHTLDKHDKLELVEEERTDLTWEDELNLLME